jgi:Solitary outer membrane autotransporter beta-barrel domain
VRGRRSAACFCLRAIAAIAFTVLGLKPDIGKSQITPQQTNQLRGTIGARIEALTILGGDFGFSDGHFNSTGSRGLFEPQERTDSVIDLTKLGGAGDIGDPQPLGNLGIGWQPRVQGNMGYLKSTNSLHSPLLEGDTSTFRDFAIQFGGGARFWLNEAFSVAPTFMGMYGHTSNEYTARGAFMRANLANATQLGLVDWNVDTWTVRAAIDFQYVVKWDRTILTFSSDPTYFYTESFRSSNANVKVSGDSGTLDNKIDLDIPLGIEWHGHELRSGGYFSRTELFGDLETGLGVEHINELHGRLVMDFLNELWKVQWIGIGASYLWGTNITGWTFGADVQFRF